MEYSCHEGIELTASIRRSVQILNVTSRLGVETGGGEAERTFQLSRFLGNQRNVRCSVLTLDCGLPLPDDLAALAATVVAIPCWWRRFNVPRGGWITIWRLVKKADVVHLIGHWSVLNVLVFVAARLANKPYVVCPAGALRIYGRSGRLKWLFNVVVGYAIVRKAAQWIAITEDESAHFEEYGVRASQVTVIRNGVSEDDFAYGDVDAFRAQHGLHGAQVVLFMGRLNSIKGPDLLLQAYLKVLSRLPRVHLVFGGPDGGMLAELRQSAAEAGVAASVHFTGYLRGESKTAAYRCAELLVVPSRQEAMSIVALEAGVCGTPVLLTDRCGFGGVRRVDARLEVPATVEGIGEGLVRLLADPAVLAGIRPAWIEFVRSRYTWSTVGQEYLALYSRVVAPPGAHGGRGWGSARLE